MKRILNWLGWKVVYQCDWGTYAHRYAAIDACAGRPIHRDMSVAPPWARMKFVRS